MPVATSAMMPARTKAASNRNAATMAFESTGPITYPMASDIA
jgi:hypothetical protein